MSLSYPYTLIINGADLSTKVQTYTYETSYVPVYGESVVTMDMVEHAVIMRWQHGLNVTINPMSESELAALASALASSNVCSVTFSSLQLGTNVTASMKLSPASAAMVLKNASRRVIGALPLSFTEM